jgi:hypothetical protein
MIGGETLSMAGPVFGYLTRLEHTTFPKQDVVGAATDHPPMAPCTARAEPDQS